MIALILHWMSIILYGSDTSSCTLRIIVALEFKGIPYDYRAPTENMKLVPQINYDGRIIGQSVAILEFIETLFPYPPLYPNDPVVCAFIRELVQIIVADTQPLQSHKFSVSVVGPNSRDVDAWKAKVIYRGFERYEQALHKIHDEIEGNIWDICFNMADVALYPQLLTALRVGVRIEDFPLICHMMKRMF